MFRTGQFPRVMTRVSMTTDKGNNQFSYEDMGSLSLYAFLSVLLGGLFCLMVRTFVKFYRIEKKWMAPHPIMIYSLSAQITAIFL